MEPDISNLSWHNFADAGFNSEMGPVYIAHTEEPDQKFYAKLELEGRHMNMSGVCHGGVLMSIADIAMGSGSWIAGGQHRCATIQMDSQFLAAAKKGQTIIAVAAVSRRTKDVSFMSCDLWGGGRQVLRANGIWKYLSNSGPKNLIQES